MLLFLFSVQRCDGCSEKVTNIKYTRIVTMPKFLVISKAGERRSNTDIVGDEAPVVASQS